MRTFTRQQDHAKKPASSDVTSSREGAAGLHHRSAPISQLRHTTGNQAGRPVVQGHNDGRGAGLFGAPLPHLAHDFSRIPVHSPSAQPIQTKLAVSTPDDKYEREADRVANQVMRMDAPSAVTKSPEVQWEADMSSNVSVSGDHEHQLRSALSEGKPLSDAERSFFEPRLGRDLTDVQIHTGSRADMVARSINAEAFTLESDIAFRKGAYDPESKQGKELLAHELAHVAFGHGARSNREQSGTADSTVIHRRGPARRSPRGIRSKNNKFKRRSQKVVQQARRDHEQQSQRMRKRDREQTREQQEQMYQIINNRVDGIIRTLQRDSGRPNTQQNTTQSIVSIVENTAEVSRAMTHLPEHALCVEDEMRTETKEAGQNDDDICLIDETAEPEALLEATAGISVSDSGPGMRAMASLAEAEDFVREAAHSATVADPNSWNWYALITFENGFQEILAISTSESRLDMYGWDEPLSVIHHDRLTEIFRQTVQVVE